MSVQVNKDDDFWLVLSNLYCKIMVQFDCRTQGCDWSFCMLVSCLSRSQSNKLPLQLLALREIVISAIDYCSNEP